MTKRIPKYSKHGTGQARVRIDGKDVYLGKYGTPESKERYNALVADLLAHRHEDQEVTVDQLAIRFNAHANEHYVQRESRGRVANVKQALRYLIALHGPESTTEFSAAKLDGIRNRMIADDLSRVYINDLIAVIKQAFRRGVVWGLVPARVWESVNALQTLAKNRTLARETAPVEPVDPRHVKAIQKHVAKPIWSMVLLQLRAGMRPSEVLNLKPGEVDQTGQVWTYTPFSHKTEHHNKQRVVMLPKTAQAVLLPYLDRDDADYCFKPSESNVRLNGKRKVGERYRRDSYRTAIQRACVKAGVPKWTPNQLRHNFGTDVRAKHGLDAARVLLGHSSKATTEIYAERDLAMARKIAAKL